MSLRGRVQRLLAKFDRRVTLAEDSVERIEGAVDNMLEVATELKAKGANLEATAERIERAVAELGRTVKNDLLQAMADERERRAGLGRELMTESARLDAAERRLDSLERGPDGRAAE